MPIKRLLDQYVTYQRKIPNASTAFEFLKEKSKIKILFITEQDIKQQANEKEIITLKGTMQIHQVVVTSQSNTNNLHREVSCFCGLQKGLKQ